MVFRKKGGALAKPKFPPANEKPKKVFEAEEDDDDDDDDDIDMEGDSDLSDSDDSNDSDDNLHAKGKQTPLQGKGTPLLKTTPKSQPQTPSVSSGKKNQLGTPFQKQTKQDVMLSGGKGPKKGMNDTNDNVNAKGKNTPTQSKGSSLTKGQAQTPVLSGKKNQAVSSVQKPGKQNILDFSGKKTPFKGMKSEQAGGDDDSEDDDDDSEVDIAGKKAEGDSDDDDDDDDDDDEDESGEEDDPTKAKMQSALNKSAVKGAGDKKDMHVSFELPKKGGLPVKAERGQQNMAAKPGAQQGKSGKQNAANIASGKEKMKGKKTEDSDDDDSDDLSDDDDEDSDDDDIDEEDDTDDEEDDDDNDEDGDDNEAIMKKVASLKKEMLSKKMKPVNETAKTQDSKNKKAKTSNQQADSTAPPPSKELQESLDKELQRKRARDALTLFVRSLPQDVTADELKALSPDILNVNIPINKHFIKGRRSLFAFLEFQSEKKAEENYEKLQKKKIRGQEIFVDFAGEKSKNKLIADTTSNRKNINPKKLFVSSLPIDSTMADIGQLFPKSFAINMNTSPEHRNCTVSYLTEEEAAAAYKATENAKVRGKAITVLYSIERTKGFKKQSNKRKRPQVEGSPQPFKKGKRAM